MVPKLKAALKKLPFAFCGGPGTGNKHLLTMTAKQLEYGLIIYDLADISNNRFVCRDKLHNLLRTAVGNTGLDKFGEAAQKTLLALYGAEHLDLEGAQMVSKSKVILLANERTTTMNSAIITTIWAPTVKPQVMQLSL